TQSSPHKLHGKWIGYSECHIEHDWLLIYKTDTKFVYLYRTGSHNDLF
ncbi:MAG: type II toxin-antitoxin system YafQ family toxin, partial [bacterium]|nr:type II toxin-antitoxin system YafQ family toxin [bacterium]